MGISRAEEGYGNTFGKVPIPQAHPETGNSAAASAASSAANQAAAAASAAASGNGSAASSAASAAGEFGSSNGLEAWQHQSLQTALQKNAAAHLLR
ncbi:hypothetical protein WJX84_010651 [Apatococcus fuscideae]|uniref:Uncharacterized protein n=1 Tax=Apatococcus fuscideae TaxID=2026836 RepID=A0AAW1SNG3_9CHLO